MKSVFTRRELLRYVSLGSAALVLAACQPKVVEVTKIVEKEKIVEKQVAVAKERKKTVMWHFFGSGADRDSVDECVNDYNSQSSNYLLTPSWVDFGASTQKTVSAIAAGNPPDVWVMTGMTIGANVMAKQVIALDGYIDASKFPWEQIVNYGKVGTTFDGKRWGMPWLPDTRFLFINTALAKEAGLDPKNPPKTWDDMKMWAPKLDKGTKPKWDRVGFNPMWGNTWVWTLAWSNGASFIDSNGKVVVNTPEVIDTAKYYKYWVDYYGGKEALDSFAQGFGADAADAFMSGKAPLQINGVWYPANLTKFTPKLEVDYALSPLGPSAKGKAGTWGCGHPLTIPTGAKNADGAWDFINYALSPEGAMKFLLTSGRMMGRMDVMQSPDVMAKWKHWATAVEAMKNTKDRDWYAACPNWADFSWTAIQEVWGGVKTPEQALNDAQAAIEKVVAQYDATKK
jgi:multiple sugar transport system substrate-binding protein